MSKKGIIKGIGKLQGHRECPFPIARPFDISSFALLSVKASLTYLRMLKLQHSCMFRRCIGSERNLTFEGTFVKIKMCSQTTYLPRTLPSQHTAFEHRYLASADQRCTYTFLGNQIELKSNLFSSPKYGFP